MFVPLLEGAELTAARHLCHYYDLGGHTGGSFAEALIKAIETGDDENRERLLTAYPEYRKGVHILRTLGGERLALSVETSTRLQRQAPRPKDRPFGPATAAALLVQLHGGRMPSAVVALRDVRSKLDTAAELGMTPQQYMSRYIAQLAKGDLA